MGRPGEKQMLDTEMETAFAENDLDAAMVKINQDPKLRRKWENFYYYLKCWTIDAKTRSTQLLKLGSMNHVHGTFRGKFREKQPLK